MDDDREQGYASQPERSAKTSMLVEDYSKVPNGSELPPTHINQQSWTNPSQASSAAHVVGSVKFGTGPNGSERVPSPSNAFQNKPIKLQLL